MISNFFKTIVSSYARVHVAIGCTLIALFFFSAVLITPNIAPEFSGSAQLHVTFHSEQSTETITDALSTLSYEVSTTSDSATEYTFMARALSDEEYLGLLDHITDHVGVYTITEYQSFSPSISRELVRKAFIALLAAALIIVLYISFVFRKVSHPIASWKYGVVAIIALLHDIIAPLGIFALLAPFTNAAIDTLFVTALLATLGYSINDTIVIFDRIRDRLRSNLEKKRKEEFAAVIDYGVRNSVRRSIYTSLSTVIPLALLFACLLYTSSSPRD